MPKATDINKELQKRIDRYISKTLKDIKVEAADEFDKNFNRQAFFNEKWARRKYNDDESRGLLVQSGTLRRSITAKVTDRASVLFQTTVPYARIHNEGGTITVTSRMKKYFWWKYITIVGSKRPKAGIATTTSRDQKDLDKIERLLADMGAAAYGLFPEGTTIDIKESSRTDCFNVYDKRIDRCNSEISKGLLTVTMTMEDGSSLSQSQVHQDMLNNLVQKDADFIRDIINWKLIPKMIDHGFPVAGFRFDWDESIDYTPEQQRQVEDMLLRYYDVEPKYWIEKYNIPVIEKKQDRTAQLVKPFFD